MQPSTQIQALFLDGPAGRLEALLNAGRPDAAYAALVAHPHPLFGGTMHNKVVFHAMKALNGLGFPTLRFDFRGVGRSEGTHDEGRGERDDVRAALDWLQRRYALPIVFAGFSFGATVGLRACCPDPRVPALISLGTPIEVEGRTYQYNFLQACAKPKLFLSGDRDPFGPRQILEAMVARAAPPAKLVLIEDSGHFFEKKLAPLRQAMTDWIVPTLALAPPAH